MTREQAAQEIKSRYTDYLQEAKKRVSGKPSYICPLCGNGTGSTGDGMTIDPHGDGTQLHCFKCGFHGDIIDLYQKETNCTTGEAFRALRDRFGIQLDEKEAAKMPVEARKEAGQGNHTTEAERPAESPTEATESEPDFTEYYRICRGAITSPAAREYLSFRGISDDTAARYWLGFDPSADPAKSGHPCPRLIIPVSKGYYIGRRTDGGTEYRKMNNKGGKTAIFNERAVYNEAGRPVFIVEGAIDALSIIEAGGEAAALNSTSNRDKLIERLKKERTRSTLILCFDNDPNGAGQKAQSDLADSLRELNIPYISGADICGESKDPNDALTENREKFIKAVQIAERSTSKPDNTADYIARSMAGEIDKLKSQAGRKSGFSNIDAEAGSIYAGLYAVGGISSVGKTTFIHQLGDQMAAQGQHVLFFSMEQSRLEMVAKSLSRRTAIKNMDTAITSLQIRTGANEAQTQAAAAEYTATVGDRMSVIEGNFSCNVSFIGEYVKQYIKQNNVKPVVIIDYLQVLRAEVDPETGRKPTDPRLIVDYNVTQLKRMTRTLEIPLFVISSVNRSNYLTPIDYEAFKESGGIEFTADVVWGLQLSAIHDPIFDKEGKIGAKRDKIAEAKEAMPRDIELVCLKNRYGKSRYTASFIYYPQFDYFKSNIGGFSPYSGKTPFDNAREL